MKHFGFGVLLIAGGVIAGCLPVAPSHQRDSSGGSAAAEHLVATEATSATQAAPIADTRQLVLAIPMV